MKRAIIYGRISTNKQSTEKRNALESRIENINQQLNVHDKTNEIRDYVKWLRNNFEKADDAIKSSILQQAVQSIVVYQDKIEVFVYLAKPYGTGKRHYNKSLSNIVRGEPLFVLSEQPSFFKNGLSNAARGVPMPTVDKQGSIYTSSGVDVISFSFEK